MGIAIAPGFTRPQFLGPTKLTISRLWPQDHARLELRRPLCIPWEFRDRKHGHPGTFRGWKLGKRPFMPDGRRIPALCRQPLRPMGLQARASVLEGRFGLFNIAMCSAPDETLDMAALTRGVGNRLGNTSVLLASSHMLAHDVIHPYVDLALNLHERGVTGNKDRRDSGCRVQPGVYAGCPANRARGQGCAAKPRHMRRASLPYCIAPPRWCVAIFLWTPFAPDALIRPPMCCALAARIMPQPDHHPNRSGPVSRCFACATERRHADGTGPEPQQRQRRTPARTRRNCRQSSGRRMSPILGPNSCTRILTAVRQLCIWEAR